MIPFSKYLNLFKLFIILLVNFGCSEKRDFLINKCLQPNTNNILIKNVSSNLIVNDTLPTFYTQAKSFMDKYLIGRVGNKNEIHIWNISNNKVEKVISIDKYLIPNFTNFYVHNLDSIFITQDPYSISLINGKGSVVNKWKLNDIPINWSVSKTAPKVPLYYFDNVLGNIDFYDKKTGNLHLTINPTDLFFFDNRKDFKLNYVYNIISKKYVCSFGEFPEAYYFDKKQRSIYLDFLIPPFSVVVGDSTYLGYPISHEVSIFNNKTGRLINKKCISSINIKTLPLPIKEYSDFEVQKEFLITSPSYGSIKYHKKIELFSRVVMHSMPYKNKLGKTSKPSERKISVIIFDKNLNQLYEYKIPDNSNAFNFGDPNIPFLSIALSDGFLGSKKLESIKNESEFRHSVIFKIIKK